MYKTTQYIIHRILSAAPITRSSDKKLLIDYWHVMGLEFTPEQREKFLDLPSPETITRIRRKLQSEGLYPPTIQVKSYRESKTQEIKEYAQY